MVGKVGKRKFENPIYVHKNLDVKKFYYLFLEWLIL